LGLGQKLLCSGKILGTVTTKLPVFTFISRMTSSDIVRLLDLKPHPEGGHYRETLRDPLNYGDRSVSTAIYFLLAAGEISHWHRIDAIEVWHWYAGAPLALSVFDESEEIIHIRLGMDLTSDERPQAFVPARAWQSARSLGPWTLVGCTVAPGFLFERFELAPSGWSPGKQG
jgi:predicted cupin superfamily sugar epimerase